MRAQDTIFRKIGSFPVVGGQGVQIQLPQDLDFSSIDIRLEGTITVTNDFTAVRALAPLQLIQQVTLTANGSKTLCKADGLSLYCKNGWQNKGKFPALTVPLGTVAAQTVACNVFVDQSMIDGVNPKDSQLPSANLSSLYLNVQIGNASDVYTVAADGVATFAGTLIITAVQSKELPDAQGNRYRPLFAQYYSQLNRDILQAQNNMQIIMLTDIIHRMFVFYATAANVASDAVLVEVRLERAGNTLATITAAEIIREMDRELGPTRPTGMYVLDPARAFGNALAKITDGYDMRAPGGGVAEQLYLYIDVLAPGATNTISIAQNYFDEYGSFITV